MNGVGPVPLTLRKLHGAGNDFLVLVDLGEAWPDAGALARALCDRHAGLGADGLLRLLPPLAGGDLRMELHNADGSLAATSGNGLRCCALAALDAGLVRGPSLQVETAAGVRHVEIRSVGDRDAEIAVEMGTVHLAAEDLPAVPPPAARGRRGDVGNPHLVLATTRLAGVDVAAIGRRFDADEPGGLNVEIVAPAVDGIELAVWERGAGLTLACGSGSCVAAAAARLWELCGDTVTVHNPGGDLRVELAGEPLAPRAVLSGPTSRVATIDVAAALPLLVGTRDGEAVA